jgi:hypothetical protein
MPYRQTVRSPHLRWRLIMWGVAAALLLAPAVAMQVTSEMAWGAEDFLILAAMLLSVCAAFELTVRLTRTPTRRVVVGVVIVGVFLLVWAQLAVGVWS